MENEKQKERIAIIVMVIFGVVLFGIVLFGIIQENNYKNELYTTIIQSIENKNWAAAKGKLDELGDYKDVRKFVPEVNYNYYLAEGDREFSNRNYRIALENYKTASNYDGSNVNLKNKITNAEKEVKKLEVQERKAQELAQRKREQERKQAKARKLQAQREQQQARNKELAELQRIVDRAFVNVSIREFGGGMPGVYEFYVYPQAWNSLTYNDKLNTLIACRKYIELKAGVSAHDAEIGTRVVNVYDNSELANYATIK